MTEAKVPDNKSDWTAIDIFVFSNGQQSSPPRKYHLVTDQLDWWKSTLNYLAQAQYGSKHDMIELYTIEGKKVDNPLQLSHNTAYVAVVPHEYFIDAGYGKYLIKATRSWEKSQGRRTSNTVVLSPEEIQILNNVPYPDEKAYDGSINTVKENESVLKTIVASLVDSQPSVIVKPQPATEKHINKNVPSYPPKQTEKLIRPAAVQHQATVKKNNLSSPPRSRKPSLKTRDSVKINMPPIKNQTSSDTAPTKERSILSDVLNNNKMTIRSKLFKPITKKRQSLSGAILTSVDEGTTEIRSPSDTKIIEHTRSISKTTVLESTRGDSESVMIPQIYENSYDNKPSQIQENPEILLSNTDNIQQSVLYINRQGAVHELFDIYDKIENDGNSIIETTHISKTNNILPLNEKDLSTPTTFSTTTNLGSNTDALITKEGFVSLKLHIEILNKPSGMKITSNAVSKKESLTTLNTETGSQVDIESKIEPEKSLHIGIRNNNDTNHGVIVVNCINNNDNTCNTIPVQNENSNFLIFLPVLKFNETCKRCNCKEDLKETKAASDGNALHKMSCESLQNEKVEKSNSHTECIKRANSIQTKQEEQAINEKNETTTIKRKSVAIKEDEIELLKMHTSGEPVEDLLKNNGKVLVNQEAEKSELVVLKKESTGVMHKTTANKLTQTDWCDMLWEARLQDDGHYSFHIPSLEMLKSNKL